MPVRKEADRYSGIRLSPDGRRIAFTIVGAKGPDLWVYDPERATSLALTHEGDMFATSATPVWTPDGRRLVYAVRQGGVHWQPADGMANAETLVSSQDRQPPYSFHPSGKYLALGVRLGAGVSILSLEGGSAGGSKQIGRAHV